MSNAALTAVQVVAIRERAEAGVGLAVLAQEHGVNRCTIREIVTGKSWTGIGGPTRTTAFWSLAVRFWRHVTRSTKPDGCWLWTASCKPNGYGQIRIDKRARYAHQVAWELSRGQPATLFVLHRCDVRNCVRPDHLFEGTQKDNVQDALVKGRLKIPGVQRAT